MPGSPRKRERRTRTAALIDDPATLRAICDFVVEGGSLVEWCRNHGVAYRDVAAWIAAEDHRREKFEQAKELRGEFLSELVIRQLRLFADLDVSRAYGPDGNLLPITAMPEDIRRAITQFEVEVDVAAAEGADSGSQGGKLRRRREQGRGVRTTKIKTVSPERAIELLGKYRKMFTDKVEHEAGETLEQLLTRSRDVTE